MSAAAKPPSRKSVVRKADALLKQLLKTPKTRAGLIAAVAGTVSRNFLYGWLTDQQRTGVVSMLKSTKPVSYQLASQVIAEQPPAGLYPAWLEPRALPASATRQAYLDGKPVNANGKKL